MTEEQKLDLMKKFKKLNVAEYTIKHGDYYGLMFAGAEIATKELQDKIKDLEWQLQEVAKDNDNYQKGNKELQEQIERIKFDAVKEAQGGNDTMTIQRVWAMPNKNTFQIKAIRAKIVSIATEHKGVWIDPFANKNKFSEFRVITNDLNQCYDTDFHLQAIDFLNTFQDESVDGVLFDPPYSPRQIKECYDNIGIKLAMSDTQASFWGNVKKEIGRIVKKGGKAICFGWNTNGIGKMNGFDIDEIMLVAHGGNHNDTIMTVCSKC